MIQMSKRIIMRVEVQGESKGRLDEFCARTGMTKIAAVSRLIDWFCRQSETLQAMIQGLYPTVVESDIATMILKNAAKKTK
jgi:hypothetical protein